MRLNGVSFVLTVSCPHVNYRIDKAPSHQPAICQDRRSHLPSRPGEVSRSWLTNNHEEYEWLLLELCALFSRGRSEQAKRDAHADVCWNAPVFKRVFDFFFFFFFKQTHLFRFLKLLSDIMCKQLLLQMRRRFFFAPHMRTVFYICTKIHSAASLLGTPTYDWCGLIQQHCGKSSLHEVCAQLLVKQEESIQLYCHFGGCGVMLKGVSNILSI